MARGGGVYITLHFGRFLFLEKILAFTVVDYSLGGRSGVPLVARGVRDGWGPGFEAGAGAGAGAGRWSLVAGRWSLVAGRWSLVAGRWSLVASPTHKKNGSE